MSNSKRATIELTANTLVKFILAFVVMVLLLAFLYYTYPILNKKIKKTAETETKSFISTDVRANKCWENYIAINSSMQEYEIKETRCYDVGYVSVCQYGLLGKYNTFLNVELACDSDNNWYLFYIQVDNKEPYIDEDYCNGGLRCATDNECNLFCGSKYKCNPMTSRCSTETSTPPQYIYVNYLTGCHNDPDTGLTCDRIVYSSSRGSNKGCKIEYTDGRVDYTTSTITKIIDNGDGTYTVISFICSADGNNYEWKERSETYR